MSESDDFMLEIKNSFLEEGSELIEKTEHCFLEYEKNPSKKEFLEEIFRCVHTIKGTAVAVGFEDLSQFAHNVENLLVKVRHEEVGVNQKVSDILLKCNDRIRDYIDKLKENLDYTCDNSDLVNSMNEIIINTGVPTPSEDIKEKAKNEPIDLQQKESDNTLIKQGITEKKKIKKISNKEKPESKVPTKKVEDYIRLPLSRIDSMLDYFGEQVILQSTLEFGRASIVKNSELLNKTIIQLGKITYDLQHAAISLRMLTLRALFVKLQRIVRDVAANTGKMVTFNTIGEDTELDKNIIDDLSGPLTHLVRNAIDHGIDSHEEREKLGKPKKGNVTLKAYRRGGFFYMEISDDGKGLDVERIREKAIDGGFINKDQQLNEEEIFSLIFYNGFSTKQEVNEVSGRGIGMDVVKSNIDKLRGSIHIASKKNKGTTFTLKLPLTLAIFNGMIILINDRKYVFPNSEIKEITKANLSKAVRINKNENIIRLKERVIPIIDTKKILSMPCKKVCDRKSDILIIVSSNGKEYGFLVDDILSQQKVVLKKLGEEIDGIQGIAGGTILGDGKVALILEINELIQLNNRFVAA